MLDLVIGVVGEAARCVDEALGIGGDDAGDHRPATCAFMGLKQAIADGSERPRRFGAERARGLRRLDRDVDRQGQEPFLAPSRASPPALRVPGP